MCFQDKNSNGFIHRVCQQIEYHKGSIDVLLVTQFFIRLIQELLITLLQYFMQPVQQPSEHSSDYEDIDDSLATQEITVSQSQSQSQQPSQPQDPIIGCDHYQRKCLVEAPCCKIFYWCKLCHDELYKGPKANWCKTQRMEFQKVDKVKCSTCEQIQQPSQKCIKCGLIFGKYFCKKCRLYQNDPKWVNKIFHCDKCAMCRKGKPEDFRHCDGCGYCVSVSQQSHKCFQIGESQCPVCLHVLKYSTKGYMPMPCGHLIHVDCLMQFSKSDYNCPICGMALAKMSESQIRSIDKLIQQCKQMPEELKQKKVNVICNQCLHKTLEAPFHFYGIKCGGCKSYNTKMM